MSDKFLPNNSSNPETTLRSGVILASVNNIKTGNKHLAFREAQKSVKAAYPDPVHWGAFVMVGE